MKKATKAEVALVAAIERMVNSYPTKDLTLNQVFARENACAVVKIVKEKRGLD